MGQRCIHEQLLACSNVCLVFRAGNMALGRISCGQVSLSHLLGLAGLTSGSENGRGFQSL